MVKRLLHVAGGLLGVIGVGFVALRLYDYSGQISFSSFSSVEWVLLFGLAFLYGSANLFLAAAWRHILAFLGVQVSWYWAVKVYGISQLAKYVPGNIVHIASRQALGLAAGVPGRQLATSSLWELALIAGAVSLFAILAVPLVWPLVPQGLSIFVFISLVIAIAVLSRLSSHSPLMSALFSQISFLLVSSISFIGALFLVLGEGGDIPPLTLVGGAFVLAWLVGLITPGAPAGVGVRELVLLFLLGNHVPQTELLLAIVLGRFVTVAGDLIYFGLSTTMKNKQAVSCPN